jgi:hypothetical protein
MAKQIGEDTKITFDLKTIGMGVAGLAALIGMWFTLQADIAEAKELPKPLPPDITRMEFDMKDKLVRQTIMTTQEDVSELKDDLDRIEEKIDKLQ